MAQHFTSTENALDAADRTLWLSVIEQAVRDARSSAATADRVDARRWLTTDTIDLRLVCAYAGLDPAYLLRHARLLAACERWFDPKTRPVEPAGDASDADESRVVQLFRAA